MTRLSENEGLRKLARKCWPKVQYKSQGAADAHIRALKKAGKEGDAATLRAYRCVHCHAFHVGHLTSV
jgi:hypothetical protein